jgi:molybdopterin-guanine dinucleotide biosynthesis protein A
MVSDVIAEAGSLGGIYTALLSVKTPYILCLACDMPFMKPAFLRHLCDTAPQADVVIPRDAKDFQPLCAVYSQRCCEPIHRQIEAGQLKITGFLDQVRVRVIDEAILAHFDPDGRMFFNANTPEEYEEARQLLQGNS